MVANFTAVLVIDGFSGYCLMQLSLRRVIQGLKQLKGEKYHRLPSASALILTQQYLPVYERLC